MDKYFLGLYGKAKEVAETIWKKSKLSIVNLLDFITYYMALRYGIIWLYGIAGGICT